MRSLKPAALCIAGLVALVCVGLLFNAVLGRYVVVFLLAFFGLSFILTLATFLLFVFTVPLDRSHKDSGKRMEIATRLYELREAKGLTVAAEDIAHNIGGQEATN